MKVVEKCSCGSETTVVAPSKLVERQLEIWRLNHHHVEERAAFWPVGVATTNATFGDPLTVWHSDTRDK